MELRDGFIVGIFNYCDRWCEACALTSRCRVFADMAEIEASLDPKLRPLTRVPGPSGGMAPGHLDAWLEGATPIAMALEAMEDDHSGGLPNADREPVPEDLVEMVAHAERYRERVGAWLQARPDRDRTDPTDPLAVLAWGHTMIGAKLARAFAFAEPGIPEDEGHQADSDGRVKAALLAIDRSHASWLSLVEAMVLPMLEASVYIGELVWLGRMLEGRFPRARAFVRPGFDEPDAVAALEWG